MQKEITKEMIKNIRTMLDNMEDMRKRNIKDNDYLAPESVYALGYKDGIYFALTMLEIDLWKF